MRAITALLPLVALVACDASWAHEVRHTSRADAGFPLPEPPPARPFRLAPRRTVATLETLPVPGFADAVASVPEGDGPWPVLVAAHGNYDKPEWQCAAWRAVVQGEAFVLCPRGVARSDSPRGDVRYTYAGSAAFARELEASLTALRGAYGGRVSRGGVVYAGFSLGAILGVGWLRRTREPVRAAVLVEGGHDGWTDGAARDFARRGGASVVFACGQGGCASDARRASARLRAAGVRADVSLARGAGHTYGGVVFRAMSPAFDALVRPGLTGG